LLCSSPALAESWRGKVVGVADGDTVRVMRSGRSVKVRLWGIDCPERAQPFGKRAKQFTSRAIFGRNVTVTPVTRDRYGRVIGKISWLVRAPPSKRPSTAPERERRQLSHQLLRAGLAWWYRRYAADAEGLAQLERRARSLRRGLWADPEPTPPWRWRRKRRSAKQRRAR
jgi:micrococcal nuclease